MGTKGGPNIILDGLVGAIDAGSYNRTNPTQVSDDYYFSLLEGTPDQRCFINDATVLPSATPWDFGLGADRNTYIQIPETDGTFDSGPFDFSAGAGYSVNVWVMRTGYGTWDSGGTNYDGIWNYYWNHYLAFSGNHTGQNYVYGTGLSNYDIDMDEWYSYTTTHDNNSATNNHKVYINGSLQQTSTVAVAGSQRRFYVGNWDSSWAMVGKFGCIRVYNRALTADEVSQNFNSQKSRFIPN
jgi:hypothetical protein|tara:strand:+ start:2875 stop:3594 length:720 start_codon:yes stop_codon:yes gene_type:complete